MAIAPDNSCNVQVFLIFAGIYIMGFRRVRYWTDIIMTGTLGNP